MEIKPNYQASSVDPTQSGRPAAKPAQVENQSTDFSSSQRLDESLRNLPDVRPEVVQRGRELVGTVNYPPPEGIRRISQLLAINLSDSE
jgi:hypothetical protein